MNKIEMMNIANEFMPGGCSVLRIKEDKEDALYRSESNVGKNKEFIIIEYNFKIKEYTMVLVKNNGEWEIQEIYDDKKEDLDYKVSDDNLNISVLEERSIE